MFNKLLYKFNNKIIKAGLWYTVGNFLLKGVVFITIPIFTRLLTTSDYGMVNTYIAYEKILSIIIGVGLVGTVKNAKYEFKEEFESYLLSVVELSFMIFMFFLLIGNTFFESIQKYFEFNQFIYNLLILSSYSSFLISFISQRYIIEFKYKKFLSISFLNTIFSVIISLIIIMILQSDKYMGRIIGNSLPMIIIGICILISLTNKKIKKRNRKKHIKFGLVMGLPLVIHYLSQNVLAQFDRIMIQKYIDPSQVGIYSFVYNIGTILIVILYSIQNIWDPWIYSKMDKKDYKTIYNNSKYYIVLFSILTIGLVTISPEIIMIMGPEEYWSGIDMILPIVLSVYFNFLYVLPVGIEYFLKKTNYIAIGTVAAAILNIILNIYFIPLYGAISAAYTTLISYICLFIFHWIILKKLFKVKLYSLIFIILSTLIVCVVSTIMIFLKNLLIIRYMLAVLLFIFLLLNYKKFNFVTKVR
ncbi:oligosaccharide flippase family protein [Defluviitalea phaphyphila]|uniref:oligosaccharide flippase family protein n=1 Tax=Defluviitalea phaphyphila TaxID=1473580 RepID=UPI000730C844|nr:oligosaccharide flippase family protein [Defluviitalea phaphyphila]